MVIIRLAFSFGTYVNSNPSVPLIRMWILLFKIPCLKSHLDQENAFLAIQVKNIAVQPFERLFF